jgi:hypothetical protein
MAKRIAYHVINYGEWTRPRLRNFREQCCDCGLIHRLDFRVVDGRIEFRTRRDDRATAPPAAASSSPQMNDDCRAAAPIAERAAALESCRRCAAAYLLCSH